MSACESTSTSVITVELAFAAQNPPLSPLYREKVDGSKKTFKLAEGVGFEPTVAKGDSGFQDRCTRPLCDPSLI